MSTLQFELGHDGIALLSIDVPGRQMNVLTPELITELVAAIQRIQTDAAIKGAIITSAKPGAFLAGADIKELATAYDRGLTPARAALVSRELSALFRKLETCGKPIAAAINGLALGGGMELCLACHYRVLIDDPKAVTGFPEVKVGLLPGAGGTQRLPRLIGIPAALPLLLQGGSLVPTEALTVGLVHALAANSALIDKARHWLLNTPSALQPWDQKTFKIPGGAGPLAAHANQTFVAGTALLAASSGENYPAPLAILSCVYEGSQVAFDVGLRIESKYFGKLLAHPVARNLARTMFINKGAAEKLSARAPDVPKWRASRIGVLGAGLMGAGIAQVAAQANLDVVLLDVTVEQADRGKASISALLAKEVAQGKTTQPKADAALARIESTADYSALAGCDLVIEAVFEDRETKAAAIRKAEAVLSANAVFASNTSTLPIGGLARASSRPAQFIGLHFFSPVAKMPLVEIIVGEDTRRETLASALDFVQQLKKTPVVVRDFPGFFTSRVFSTFVQEGLKMLEEGVAAALIENAAKLAGFPIGPLAVSDEVTLTLQQQIQQQHDLDGVAARYRIVIGRSVVDRMVNELGRPGRRAGGGFYDYPAAAPKKLWPGLSDAFAVAARQPSLAEVKDRLLFVMALESVRCLEDGVIHTAADADIASILGIGYPSWTGGTLSYIDTVGVQPFVARCLQLAALHGPRFEPPAELRRRAEQGIGFYPSIQA